MIDMIMNAVNWDAVFGAFVGALIVFATMGFDKLLDWAKASKTTLDDRAAIAVVTALVEKGIVKETVLAKVKAKLGVE